MTATFTVHEAKTSLSKLIKRACGGEEIVIACGKNPLVRLQPLAAARGRAFGTMRGKARTDERFFAPLPHEALGAWER